MPSLNCPGDQTTYCFAASSINAGSLRALIAVIAVVKLLEFVANLKKQEAIAQQPTKPDPALYRVAFDAGTKALAKTPQFTAG
jgi:hypothetical protein